VAPRVAVLAPAPELDVTVEAQGADCRVHLHPGGQGVWVARMAAELGAQVTLCCTLGGETGTVLRTLLDALPVEIRAVSRQGWSGSTVRDARRGRPRELARASAEPPGRHTVDDLFDTALVAGLEADVLLLTGTEPGSLVPAHVFRRLARDLRSSGTLVVADLTGAPLRAALAGGLDVVKLSHLELQADGWADLLDAAGLLRGALALRTAGADTAVVSRDTGPTLVVGPAGQAEVTGPHFHALDPRGCGDAMFAAMGVALAGGDDVHEAVRHGVAAGALNATRRGKGTGSAEHVARLVDEVAVLGPDQVPQNVTKSPAAAGAGPARSSRSGRSS
jgi:1-phosphofructokinase